MSQSLALVNEALVRLGVPPLASLEDRTAQSLAAATLYQNVTDDLLSDHPWHFSLRETRLAQLSPDQLDLRLLGYKFVYQLPTDYLRVLGLSERGHYALAGDQLYTDTKDATLVYVVRSEAREWPAYFRELVVFELAAAFAMTLTDSTSRADVFYRRAAQERPRARAIDSQQTPPYVFDLMRIYTARRNNPLGQA